MNEHYIAKDDSDKPKEYCGVFGLYAPCEAVAKLTFFGLYALQHRGQESAGIATYDGKQLYSHKGMGLVSQVFHQEEVLDGLPGYWAVGHNRYSTTGVSHSANAQPAIEHTRLGEFALAHNGNLVNAIELKEALLGLSDGVDFQTTTDSELIAKAISIFVDQGQDWDAAARSAFALCSGAYSLVIGTPEGIIGARDPHGVRPLVIGVLETDSGERQYVLASETCAFDNIGARFLREVAPGEMVWINADGLRAQQWAPATERKLCIFEMIYFARPDSVFKADNDSNESLFRYRERLGESLARQYLDSDAAKATPIPLEDILVIGVPDSGIPAAIGFSRESGFRYGEGLIKNRYVGRTFIQPTQQMREIGIKMKLNPLKDALENKVIFIIDDSIVRGTTSRKIVRALREAGAKAVHMFISSPPVTHPCFYGIDTDTQDQLIAATKGEVEIARQIEVDSLTYLKKESMLALTHEDTNSFCTACFDGNYPITIPDAVKGSKLMLEESTH